MNKFIQTNLSAKEQPIMVVDSKGYAHCVWQKNGAIYTKFNGSCGPFARKRNNIKVKKREMYLLKLFSLKMPYTTKK